MRETPAPHYFASPNRGVVDRADALLSVCDLAPLAMGIAQMHRETGAICNRFSNRALAAYFGVDPLALQDRTLEEIGISKAIIVLWQQRMRLCLDTGDATTFEYDFEERAVSPITVRKRFVKATFWHLSSEDTLDGACFAYLIEDISPHRVAEDAIRDSRRFLEQVAATTPHIWYVYDLQEQCTIYANREIAGVLGYNADEIQAMGATMIPALIHPDDLPQVQKRFADYVHQSDGAVGTNQFRVKHRSGAYRWLDCHDVPFARDAQTGLVRQILGVSQDITERRNAVDALAKSESHLRLAVEGGDIGTFVSDFVTGIVELSPETRRHLGLPATQETLTLAEMQSLVYEPDRAGFDAAMQKAVRERSLLDAEYRAYQRDGSLRWGSIKAQFVFDEATGSPLQMIGVCVDIEERKRAETVQNAETDKQTRIAQVLQRSLLSVAPPGGVFHESERDGIITLSPRGNGNGWQVALLYEPAWSEAQVGGDFYDVFAVDEERTAFVVGDVSGKGLGAAESVAEIRFGLRSVLRGISADPAFALRFLNDRQIEAQTLDGRSRELLIAVTIVVADDVTGALHIARAGAEPPLICRRNADGALLRPVSDVADLPIGAMPETQYKTISETLGDDEMILLYTDGLTDGVPFFSDTYPLHNAAWAIITGTPCDEWNSVTFCRRLVDAMTRAAGGGNRRDDMCVLVAGRKTQT